MSKRLFAATCLAVAVSGLLASASALATAPLPISLVGALLPTQDDELEADSEAEPGEDPSDVEAAGDGEQDESATEDSGSDAAEVEEPVEEMTDEEAAAPEEAVAAEEPEAEAVADEPVADAPAAPEPAPPVAAPPVPITANDPPAAPGEAEDTTLYTVVINHEEQYSIWPANRETPAGWNVVGEPCLKSACLERIKEVWTDMRPLSLRKKMEEAAQGNGGQ